MVPCSRVGHMFRHDPQTPYEVSKFQVQRNLARIAMVWLQPYLGDFYRFFPLIRKENFSDMDELIAKNEKLQCQDMDWYLLYVDMELAWERSRLCYPGTRDAEINEERCMGRNGWGLM